jgi:hypothetical protein
MGHRWRGSPRADLLCFDDDDTDDADDTDDTDDIDEQLWESYDSGIGGVLDAGLNSGKADRSGACSDGSRRKQSRSHSDKLSFETCKGADC